MFKRALTVVLALLVLAVIGGYALSYRAAIAPIEPASAANFPQELVDQGAKLAGAGNCASCHTRNPQQPFAGGVAFATKFGTIYSTNITPDPGTGIGAWPLTAFSRALRQGVARDGSQLFPVFPFDHFTKVSDGDVRALYAFFMTRRPVARPPERNTLPFPLNVRALQAGWKLLFFHAGEYRPNAAKSAAWNRGAYLAESLAHCSSCHTPRNALGAESAAAAYAGAVIEGWYAPALNAANPAPLPWTVEELYAYLRTGGTALHGSAAGSMSDVVHHGLAALPDADVLAIATYFADLNESAKFAGDPQGILAKSLRPPAEDDGASVDPGAHLYLAACASCHYNSGSMPQLLRPELALNSALWAPNADNFIQVVLHGISIPAGLPETMMPGFSTALSDEDIAQLAAYLRHTRTPGAAWPELQPEVAALRRAGRGT
ncbi:MAG TPA: cytochrome c [Steroidobacteraceae bacterium]|nr:cytochrome c [Steroidobacteraceae bacterium]